MAGLASVGRCRVALLEKLYIRLCEVSLTAGRKQPEFRMNGNRAATDAAADKKERACDFSQALDLYGGRGRN